MRPGLNSIAVRQAVISTLVVLAAVAAFAAIAIGIVDHGARADLLRTIDTDIAGLTDINSSGGTAELQRRIADRTDLAQVEGAAPLYFLADARGERLAGNLAAMPAVDAARSQAVEIGGSDGPALVRATRFRGGLVLVVGRSLGPALALTRYLRQVFIIGWIMALLASLLIGFVSARSLARRVTVLNDTFDRFDGGDLAARARASKGRDEIALLSSHVDGHLARIEQLIEAQRQISDNIAHELRTPLVHLDSRLIEALAADPSALVAEQLVRARADIRSIVLLFDALLDIALAEDVNRVGVHPAVDLSQLATDLAELYAASAEEAGIDFSTRIAPNVALTGEPMQVTRLLANLLDNAFKYVPAGSQVRLTVAPGPSLTIEDNGPGIAAADREVIFERFRRSAASGPGHGLGLALVKVIAARHGLSARVEDAQPGARFIVEPVQ